MVIDQLTSVVALLATVALAGHAPDWTVPAVAVLYSVTRPFSSGTFVCALAEIAGRELLDDTARDHDRQQPCRPRLGPDGGRHSALRRAHAEPGAHAGGYLWAALALGSILGTFALAGRP